jgi:nicotinamide-nucleotide amidase
VAIWPSSQWFDCGYVCYANSAKMRDLGVREITLATHGAVSEATVAEMALGALAQAGVPLSLAISGVAGPDGGSDLHPVGEVWFGVARLRGGKVEVQAFQRRFAGSRDAVRRQSVAFALELIEGA